MINKNVLRVEKFRKSKGHSILKKKYHKLRFKYDIASKQSNIMKFWSIVEIKKYLKNNNIHPTEEYLNSLEEADKI